MAEDFLAHTFESDIAQLARTVEEKRISVEREAGIVPESEKEMVRAALTHEAQSVGVSTPVAPSVQQDPQKSYLDELSSEDQQTVRELLTLVEEQGIKKALIEAEEKSPYLLDVFHDELTDKLYTVLKERGHIT